MVGCLQQSVCSECVANARPAAQQYVAPRSSVRTCVLFKRLQQLVDQGANHLGGIPALRGARAAQPAGGQKCMPHTAGCEL